MQNRCVVAGLRPLVVACLFLGLGPAVPSKEAAAATPEEVLRASGLHARKGRYILQDEEGVLKDLPAARKAVDEAEEARRRLAAARGGEGDLQAMQAQVADLQAQARELEIQVRTMPRPRLRNSLQHQVALRLAETHQALNTARHQLAQSKVARPKGRQADQPAVEAERLRSEAYSRVDKLQGAIDSVEQKYLATAEEESVRSALAASNRANKTNLKITPSDEFAAARTWARRKRKELSPATADGSGAFEKPERQKASRKTGRSPRRRPQ